TYSNGAKKSVLGVRPDTLDQHGAVSEATVSEMAHGILGLSGADYAVAVSGIAGPSGGTDDKPVGTVWLAWAWRDGETNSLEACRYNFRGSRDEVRSQSVVIALQGLRERLRAHG
ncbi:MAG: CinA family protein, partial [Gammaproteobacteria bacterium]|nr:CinA family protein [Gammaproteobacteria bacterium]